MKTKLNVLMTLIASLLCVISFSSCEFDNVAKKMNGTWSGKSVKTNDDQSKEHQTIYYKFNYDEKSGTGGSYIEVRDVQVEGYEIFILDNAINISYRSYIEGVWSVTEDGELAMKPDLNTLKVTVNPNVKEIQKDIFSDLHTEYEMKYDKDLPFSDLQVQEDAMSFVSYDDVKTTLQKTNVDIMSVFNQASEPTRSKSETSASQEDEESEDVSGDEATGDEDESETDVSDEDEDNDM